MLSIDYVKEHIDEIEHAKECIVKALYDEGYTIDDFYEDGMLIDLDGIGFAKVKIQKAD